MNIDLIRSILVDRCNPASKKIMLFRKLGGDQQQFNSIAAWVDNELLTVTCSDCRFKLENFKAMAQCCFDITTELSEQQEYAYYALADLACYSKSCSSNNTSMINIADIDHIHDIDFRYPGKKRDCKFYAMQLMLVTIRSTKERT